MKEWKNKFFHCFTSIASQDNRGPHCWIGNNGPLILELYCFSCMQNLSKRSISPPESDANEKLSNSL